ncbi:hypothetical protein HFP57_04335 [Parasphingopyxis algicola]|uniref:hypothetical protein n=1 Tax=Parasphingopyxis algicola TaxID=2026624 RepID=UPI0015A127AB|nr:hypothetical protein [Parasphingopyxis algicola]QLC24329.1 hypothetical protein HFP57_04335 [Parasphingopyxis algicola]
MRPLIFCSVALALSACGSAADEQTAEADPLIEAETEARAELAESGMVYCAVNGAASFRPDCRIERTRSSDGLILTLRHPDGGFRRLLVTGDGRGLVAADGAEPAVVNPVSEREIEVAIAFDRYRLPATVR